MIYFDKFKAKVTHFKSTRTDMTHVDKFKDQNDAFCKYKDRHNTPVQVWGPAMQLL